MRLLNVKTKKLKTFYTDHPEYAILSHTWLEDHEEVTYLQIQDPEACKHLPGYAKIELTCQQAIRDGCDWAWIDTCCIDKTSSAELSEAINSMFKWYRSSKICYAYLTDVSHLTELCNSRWWTRSWTLQEFLCPSHVVFYNRDWLCLGTKHDNASLIAKNIRIDMEIIASPMRIQTVSVAKRMSWAASRTAKRTEDIAYSLLGIFRINMPLLYGEGANAFRRLQGEILKSTGDLSLFAWNFKPWQSHRNVSFWDALELDSCPRYTDMFAHHPKSFDNSHSLVNIPDGTNCSADVREFNGAIKMTIPLIELPPEYHGRFGLALSNYFIGLLPCFCIHQPGYLTGVLLSKSFTLDLYARSIISSEQVNASGTFLVSIRHASRAEMSEIWVTGQRDLTTFSARRLDSIVHYNLVIECFAMPPDMHYIGAIPDEWEYDAANTTLTFPKRVGSCYRSVLAWYNDRDQSVLCVSLMFWTSWVPEALTGIYRREAAPQDVRRIMKTVLHETPTPTREKVCLSNFEASVEVKRIFNHVIFMLKLVGPMQETPQNDVSRLDG